MFLDELGPVVTELTRHPVAFMGGFVSGLFRLNLSDDPVKSWLVKQSGQVSGSSATDNHSNNGSTGPQTIAIE